MSTPTIVPVNPFVMRNVEFIVETFDFRQHLTGCKFKAAPKKQTIRGLGNNSHSDQATPDWTVDIGLMQDWENPDSLANFLLEHDGEQVDAKFHPIAGGVGFTSTLSISAAGPGGDEGNYATDRVTLGCTKPVRVIVPPTP